MPPPRSSWEARVSWSGCPFEHQSRQPLKPSLQGGPEQAFRGGCVCDSEVPVKADFTCVLHCVLHSVTQHHTRKLLMFWGTLETICMLHSAWVSGSEARGRVYVSICGVCSLIPLSQGGLPQVQLDLCSLSFISLEVTAWSGELRLKERGQASVRVESSLAAFLPAFHTPSSWGILSSFLFCY